MDDLDKNNSHIALGSGKTNSGSANRTRIILLAVYGLTIGAIVLIFSRISIEPSIWLIEEHARNLAYLASIGWIIATACPVFLSFSVWLLVRRFRMRWLTHLIFVPIAIISVKYGSYLFFYAVNASGDNSPEGFALLMAGMLLILTLVVHVFALIFEIYNILKNSGNSGDSIPN